MTNSTNNLGDMPPDEFRKYAYALSDWLTAHFQNLDDIPVLPDVQPGDITQSLPKSAPENGDSFDDILKDIDRIIMPGMTHWNHPNFFAYFSITGSGPGILGELLTAAFNVNGMLWKTCPSATELEQVTLNWLRQMIGLPEKFWGIVYDTASVSTLHAIAAAREQTVPSVRQQGLTGAPRLRLYCSDQTHSSIEKAAITLGLGLDSVRKIPSDDKFQMQPQLLSQAIIEDRNNGLIPFCVVATVGTTSTTSIDPVTKIADIAERENLWLHVDAAYGGAAAVVPEMQDILAGCDRADSFVLNPHKWLFVPIDFSAFYTTKPDLLKRAFSLVPEYLQTDESSADNLMDYGIQLGRRFRALKLWFVLRYFGREGLARRIRQHLEFAREFRQWVEADPEFEIMAPVRFSTLCFRAHPKNLSDTDDLNSLNKRLLQKINSTRAVFLSHTQLGDYYVLRLAIGNLHTQMHHLERAWDIIREQFKRIQSS